MAPLAYLVALLLIRSAASLKFVSLTKQSIERNAFALGSVDAGSFAQDAGVSLFGLGASTIWIKIWTSLAKSGKIDPKLSRKIIHTTSAPLFMCVCWPLAGEGPASQYISASVPFVQMVRLMVAGIKTRGSDASGSKEPQSVDGELVNAISRSGDMKEALGGPLIYTVVLLLSTAFFFKHSPIGIVAVCQMAIGDGLADIVGRRYGSQKWFLSPNKSYAGSAAFATGAFVGTSLVLALFSSTGSLDMDVAAKLPIVLLISVLCALVELLPLGRLDDNVSVPLAAALLAKFLL